MADAVLSRAEAADLVVMAAAVADYRPAVAATTKLHKATGRREIRLVPTLDILAELGAGAAPGRCWSASRPRPDSLAERGGGQARGQRRRSASWATTSQRRASGSRTRPTP